MKLERSLPEDLEDAAEWMADNVPQNDASLESLKHCTFFKVSGILHLPVKVVLMLESLAPNPKVTGKRRLLALRRAMDDLRKLYPQVEIIFLSKGNTVLDQAARYYGFTEMPFKVYRMQPDDKSGAAKKYRAEVTTEEVRTYA